MIIKFFACIFEITMALCGTILVACMCMIGLACFDYLCDSNIKGVLVEGLGPRPVLRKIRDRVVIFFKKYEKPSKEDLIGASMKDYERYYLDKTDQTDDNFNAEVHSEIDKIFDDVD